jgi:hypothetical protein
MFPIVDLLTCQILSIIGLQIESERIFFFSVDIFINLRTCHLQLDNLENLIFLRKNWSSDHNVDCISNHISIWWS